MERRRETRMPCKIQARLADLEGAKGVEGKVLDINGLGMQFDSPSVALGTGPIAVDISAEPASPRISILGEIRWQSGSRIGVKFIAMMPYQRNRLRRFLEGVQS